MSNPTITPDAPVFISVTPTNIAIAFGTTVQLTVTLTDVDGNTIEPTAPFTYSSSNSGLLTVDEDGLCTAMTPQDMNVLNTGGIVQITTTYPFQNRTDTDSISAVSTMKVLANTARTQAVLRTGDIIAGDSAYSRWVDYQAASASAPAPTYPSNWVISE
jgi:Bacterial Ig-like domain (group 2)